MASCYSYKDNNLAHASKALIIDQFWEFLSALTRQNSLKARMT